MILNLFKKNKKKGQSGSMEPPWDAGRQSIYTFLQNHTHENQAGLPEEAHNLPDEDIFYSEDDIHWIAGGLDGAFGHHGGESEDQDVAEKIFFAMKTYFNQPNSKNLKVVYHLLFDRSALDFLDSLMPLIANDQSLDFDQVYGFALWLATEAPDRNPVKIGIAVLGLFQGDHIPEILMTFGRHDEFTLYAAVGLSNSLQDSESNLWKLAKNVTGWGRIQLVERLSETNNPKIKQWMLREGYKNSIMYEYTAFICAEVGGLLKELEQDHPDDALIKAAGEILDTLITGEGGPAQGMEDYEDGAKATELYINHIKDRDIDLEQFLIVANLKRFMESEADWSPREKQGWTQDIRTELLIHVEIMLSMDGWKEKVMNLIQSRESRDFYTATRAADILKIDTWPYYFERQKTGTSNEWYYLMQTEDSEKIDQVLALAETQIPFEEVATGPAQKTGFGPAYKYHSALDFIVQDLRRFPGKGWSFVKASLQSPVIRNRHMSLKALEEWGKGQWPNDAEQILNEAYETEPDEKVKESIQKVRQGLPLDDGQESQPPINPERFRRA